jgi:hypoxia up-regulated 1
MSKYRHMDADEAMVMGAAYFAANLSTVFRLRKFGMADKSPYQISFKIINESSILSNEDDQEGVGPNTELVLVPALKRMPSKRTISLNNVSEDSFAVSLTFNNSVGAALPCCQKAGPLGYFNVSGIKGVISKYNHSGKVALHMGVEQGGEFYIGRAEATVEILKEEVTFTKPPQNPSPKNTTSSIPADQRNVTLDEPNADNSTATNSSVGNQDNLQEEKGGKKITKVVKRTVKVPLRLIGDIEPRGLTLEERLASKKVLRALKQRDEMKRATAKARNDLEAFIISARERVESDKELAAVSTEAEREDIQASLTDAEDWLYGDGETANASEYKDRFSSLLKKVDALDIRAAEKTHRPEAIEMAKSFIELTLKAANAWNQTKPWLNASAVENLVEAATSLKDWLVTKVEEQTKLAAHEDPVLRVGDIKVRIDGLRKTFNRLNNSRPPRPPSKAKKASKEANGTADSADSADSADAEFATKTEKAEEVTVEEDGQHDEL